MSQFSCDVAERASMEQLMSVLKCLEEMDWMGLLEY